MLWRCTTSELAGHDGVCAQLVRGDEAATWRELMLALRDDDEARRCMLEHLREAPHEAYFWETPPVTQATSSRPYEHVLLEGGALTRMRADRQAFFEHFQLGERVVSFENLGGDAVLVVPAPESQASEFTHFAAFVRTASTDLALELLRQIGTTALERLSNRPMWISTAGQGVPWLHVRLDSRPKYYKHAPYRLA